MEALFAPYKWAAPVLSCGSITRGHLTFVDSLCIPLASCPDAAHAEAAAAAGAVQLAAKHFPRLSPTRIVIKGDNKAVIDFMTNTGKYRRPDLQQALQEAHHLLAFAYPRVIGAIHLENLINARTTCGSCPRSCSGMPRFHNTHISAIRAFPFFCPLPPSLSPSFNPPRSFPLRLPLHTLLSQNFLLSPLLFTPFFSVLILHTSYTSILCGPSSV